MRAGGWMVIGVVAIGSLPSSPVSGQDGGGLVVIQGRVEDAVTREPLAGVRIGAPDSMTSVLTDSVGSFVISVARGGAVELGAERFGYVTEQFTLDPTAAPRAFVLLLDPAPVEIEGVTVVEEAAVTELETNLKNRRNAYPYRMMALDGARLERSYRGGTALDVVRTRVPRMQPCYSSPGQFCVPGRFRSFRNSRPESLMRVCLDGWASWLPEAELGNLPIESVALLEVYFGAAPQVRVYTDGWMLSRAGAGRTRVRPLIMGC